MAAAPESYQHVDLTISGDDHKPGISQLLAVIRPAWRSQDTTIEVNSLQSIRLHPETLRPLQPFLANSKMTKGRLAPLQCVMIFSQYLASDHNCRS